MYWLVYVIIGGAPAVQHEVRPIRAFDNALTLQKLRMVLKEGIGHAARAGGLVAQAGEQRDKADAVAPARIGNAACILVGNAAGGKLGETAEGVAHFEDHGIKAVWREALVDEADQRVDAFVRLDDRVEADHGNAAVKHDESSCSNRDGRRFLLLLLYGVRKRKTSINAIETKNRPSQ